MKREGAGDDDEARKAADGADTGDQVVSDEGMKADAPLAPYFASVCGRHEGWRRMGGWRRGDERAQEIGWKTWVERGAEEQREGDDGKKTHGGAKDVEGEMRVGRYWC